MTFTPVHILHREKEKQRKIREQKLDLSLKTFQDNATKVASDNITYNQKHKQSMMDALNKVRESNVTHEDTTQVTRPNSSGFHR